MKNIGYPKQFHDYGPMRRQILDDH